MAVAGIRPQPPPPPQPPVVTPPTPEFSRQRRRSVTSTSAKRRQLPPTPPGVRAPPPIFIPDSTVHSGRSLLHRQNEMGVLHGVPLNQRRTQPMLPLQPQLNQQLHQHHPLQDLTSTGSGYVYDYRAAGFVHSRPDASAIALDMQQQLQQPQQHHESHLLNTEAVTFDGLKDEDLFDDEFTDCPASSHLEYEDYYWSHRPFNQISSVATPPVTGYHRRSHKRRHHQQQHGSEHQAGSSTHWNASSSSSRWHRSSRSGSIKQLTKRQFGSYSYAPV